MKNPFPKVVFSSLNTNALPSANRWKLFDPDFEDEGENSKHLK